MLFGFSPLVARSTYASLPSCRYYTRRTKWAFNSMMRSKREKEAATKIQSAIRMVLAKKRVAAVRLGRVKGTSALRLQCFWRMGRARNIMRTKRFER
jgi:hypothetical protein